MWLWAPKKEAEMRGNQDAGGRATSCWKSAFGRGWNIKWESSADEELYVPGATTVQVAHCSALDIRRASPAVLLIHEEASKLHLIQKAGLSGVAAIPCALLLTTSEGSEWGSTIWIPQVGIRGKRTPGSFNEVPLYYVRTRLIRWFTKRISSRYFYAILDLVINIQNFYSFKEFCLNVVTLNTLGDIPFRRLQICKAAGPKKPEDVAGYLDR